MPTIPKSLQPPARPQTVKQTQVIKQYEAGKISPQIQTSKPQQALQTEIDRILSDINEGRITSSNQIPSNLKQYINLPQDYFKKQKEYQKLVGSYTKIEKYLDTHQEYDYEIHTKALTRLGFSSSEIRMLAKALSNRHEFERGRARDIARVQSTPEREWRTYGGDLTRAEYEQPDKAITSDVIKQKDILSQWSAQHQQTPSPEMVQKILTQGVSTRGGIMIPEKTGSDIFDKTYYIKKEISSYEGIPTYEIQKVTPGKDWDTPTKVVKASQKEKELYWRKEREREYVEVAQRDLPLLYKVERGIEKTPEYIRELGESYKEYKTKSDIERDKKIEEGRSRVKDYYEKAGYDVSEDFRAGALTTGLTTTQERKELSEHINKQVSKITDSSINAVPLPLPLFIKKLVTYDESTGTWRRWEDMYPDRKTVTIKEVGKDVVKYFDELPEAEKEKRYTAALKVTEAKYGQDFQNLVYLKFRKELESGELTWEQAIRKTEQTKEYKDLLKSFQLDLNKKLEEYTKEYAGYEEHLWGFSKSFVSSMPSTPLSIGASVTAAKYIKPTKLIPFIYSEPITKVAQAGLEYNPLSGNVLGQFGGGAAVGFIGGASLGVAYGKEFAKGLIKDPFETIAGTIEYAQERPGELAGLIVGGGLRSKKTKAREQAKVSEALRNTELKVEPIKGILTEIKIKALDISNAKKTQLISELKKGNSVRIYEIKEIINKRYAKYQPKITGRFIEVSDVNGNVIRTTGAGGLKVTYKGKSVDAQLFSETVSYVNEATKRITGELEVVTGRLKGKKLVDLQKRKFIQDTQIVMDITRELKKGDPFSKRRIVVSQSQAKLLSKSKYLGEELLGEYKRTGVIVIKDVKAKPFFESISGEIHRPLSKKVRIDRVKDVGLFGTETRWGITGEAIARRFKDTKKPTRPRPSKAMPGFKDLYDKPKPELSITEQQFINVVRDIPKDVKGLFDRKQVQVQVPKSVTKQIVGGIRVESIWAGKQFKVPSGTEAAALSGISDIQVGNLVSPGFRMGGLISGFGLSIGKDFQGNKDMIVSVTDNKLDANIISSYESVLIRDKDITKVSRGFTEALASTEIEVSKEKVKPKLLQPSMLFQPQVQPQVQEQRTTPKITPTQIVTPTITPTTIIPIIKIPSFFPGEEYKRKTQVGYHSFVKDKKKWKKVSIKPHTERSAMSLGARITDNTTSGQFKTEKIKETRTVKGKKRLVPKAFKSNELVREEGYFKQVAHKFRDYTIHKGRRRPIKNRWIEKKQFRSDTKGESQGLTIGQMKSRQRKITLGLPIRRKSKSKKSYFRL